MLPPEEWRDAVKALPAEKLIAGVRWPYRRTVIARLQLAKSMEQNGCRFSGWPERTSEALS